MARTHPVSPDLLEAFGQGLQHAIRQRARRLDAIQFHRDCFSCLTSYGFSPAASDGLLHASSSADQLRFGCMACRLSFSNSAGEGAHMNRAHGQVSRLRHLFDGTQCLACMKEYHSTAKLHAHLRRVTRCRQLLVGSNQCFVPVAGSGSLIDGERAHRHKGLLPHLPVHGPRLQPRAPREAEVVDCEVHVMLSACF